MPFEPDILVASEFGTDLLMIVEVKLRMRPSAVERFASPLKRYMASMNVETGVLISPQVMAIFVESYRGEGADSILKVAECTMDMVFPDFQYGTKLSSAQERKRAYAFERRVHRWLERLVEEPNVHADQGDVHRLIGEYLLPNLKSGTVRPAPHSRMTGW